MNVDLNALVREPGRVQTLPTAEARDVLPQLAALVVSLAVRASQEAPTDGAKPELLNADQVLAQFGLPAGWLADHRRELEQAGIVVRASHKLHLYKVTRLRTWLAARCLTPGA